MKGQGHMDKKEKCWVRVIPMGHRDGLPRYLVQTQADLDNPWDRFAGAIVYPDKSGLRCQKCERTGTCEHLEIVKSRLRSG